jgi:hypothetical protein
MRASTVAVVLLLIVAIAVVNMAEGASLRGYDRRYPRGTRKNRNSEVSSDSTYCIYSRRWCNTYEDCRTWMCTDLARKPNGATLCNNRCYAYATCAIRYAEGDKPNIYQHCTLGKP